MTGASNAGERDYRETIAEILAELRSSVRERFRHRESVSVHFWRQVEAEIMRRLIRRIRALDAVVEHARERDYMARVWMYIACGLTKAEAANRARAEMAAQEPRR